MSAISYRWLVYQVADSVATIRLNRPENLNALHDELLREIFLALGEAERDVSVRVLVVTGEGGAFCSGQDLKVFAGGVTEEEVHRHLDDFYHPVVRKFRSIPKPIVAAIPGVAAGAGMSLALAADLRIAAQTARFSQAFVRIGLVPDSGSTYFLPRLIGPARALEMAWLGDGIDAETAKSWGLVNWVVAADELPASTKELTARLAEGPPLAVAMIKQAIYRGMDETLDDTLEFEKRLQGRAVVTADHQTGLKAFFAKTRPVFTGR
ncbi:MAG: enoyl-CoA hydratase-related protein [Thermaerobacter sp.]|nr:enoyl-CoA hydratase-related protein [Thermaerobacter sp.]